MTISAEEIQGIDMISPVEELQGGNDVVDSTGEVRPKADFTGPDGTYELPVIDTPPTEIVEPSVAPLDLKVGSEIPKYKMGPHESRVEAWISSHDVYGNPDTEDACAALGIDYEAYLAEVAASIEAWQTNNRSPQDKLGSRALTNARSK